MDDTFIYFVALVAIMSCLFLVVKLTNVMKAHLEILNKYRDLLKEHLELLKRINKEE
ncbi:hypothetical protein [Myroides sp.]|uniref:hypothetical protein n=1 Tax=Myroides sp. TaxID=1874736 RepID=UPI0028AE109D|nr:hypothetical protein [Myroides sp.]